MAITTACSTGSTFSICVFTYAKAVDLEKKWCRFGGKASPAPNEGEKASRTVCMCVFVCCVSVVCPAQPVDGVTTCRTPAGMLCRHCGMVSVLKVRLGCAESLAFYALCSCFFVLQSLCVSAL